MEKHTRKEDWMAILTGTFLVAQGVFFLQSANLLTGGTTGLALLISQFTPLTFGVLYFIANCPFYLLAWKRFGRTFAINSAISGALVSIFADNISLLISLDTINEIY
ncbi:YitT family protein, partial [Vibrio makurazakiensis]|uniref:YitT family protein n=1 Tax=Vibrio makurazakiensis TaxID=2910250 RepID=UPI003D11ABA6